MPNADPGKKPITIYEEGHPIQIPDRLGEYMHAALNKALDDDAQMKPWAEMSDWQKSDIASHVNDMSSWRGEGKVDTALADYFMEYYPHFHTLLA